MWFWIINCEGYGKKNSCFFALVSWLDDHCSIPGREEISIFSGQAMGPTQPPFQFVPAAVSPWVDRLACEAHRLTPSNAYNESAWSYTSTPYISMASYLIRQYGQIYFYVIIVLTALKLFSFPPAVQWAVNLMSYLAMIFPAFMNVKIDVSRCNKSIYWGRLRRKCWGEYLGLRNRK
jgi:hypothetical protein